LPETQQPMKFLLSLIFLCLATAGFGQKDTILPAYKRFPTLPALQLLLADSTTKYTKEDVPKKKAVLLMIFSPDCEHCQHEAEELVARKEAFKDIHIIMATTLPIYKMKEFGEKYGLDQLTNVVIAKDPYFLLPGFYEIRNLPFMALYNKKGMLLRTYEGSVGLDKILQIFNEAK
jgi:thioredoxin-related protein